MTTLKVRLRRRRIWELLSTQRPMPTVRELSKATGMRTLSVIVSDLDYLEDAGYIERFAGVCRGVRVVLPFVPATVRPAAFRPLERESARVLRRRSPRHTSVSP